MMVDENIGSSRANFLNKRSEGFQKYLKKGEREREREREKEEN